MMSIFIFFCSAMIFLVYISPPPRLFHIVSHHSASAAVCQIPDFLYFHFD